MCSARSPGSWKIRLQQTGSNYSASVSDFPASTCLQKRSALDIFLHMNRNVWNFRLDKRFSGIFQRVKIPKICNPVIKFWKFHSVIFQVSTFVFEPVMWKTKREKSVLVTGRIGVIADSFRRERDTTFHWSTPITLEKKISGNFLRTRNCYDRRSNPSDYEFHCKNFEIAKL